MRWGSRKGSRVYLNVWESLTITFGLIGRNLYSYTFWFHTVQFESHWLTSSVRYQQDFGHYKYTIWFQLYTISVPPKNNMCYIQRSAHFRSWAAHSGGAYANMYRMHISERSKCNDNSHTKLVALTFKTIITTNSKSLSHSNSIVFLGSSLNFVRYGCHFTVKWRETHTHTHP